MGSPASAAAYSKGVYTPYAVGGGVIEAWANVSTDCDGTLGCWTYIKIERQTLAGWWVEHTGGWASDGWNRVAAPALECGNYRLVVESYNDAPGEGMLSFGVEYSKVHANVGTGSTITRYKRSAYSRQEKVCPLI